jgi:Bacteriocin-protection, YdeI or OmpD-Associated/Domain of unknown function (DUF1905)
MHWLKAKETGEYNRVIHMLQAELLSVRSEQRIYKESRRTRNGSRSKLPLEKQLVRHGRASAQPKETKPKYIPVVAVVNGKLARTTLVPAGGGRFRMAINTALRKAAGADRGDLVGVELRLDRESRELPLPRDLEVGLKQHPKAWRAFQALPPGHRRQFIQWFDSAKSAEARGRRLNRAVDALLERAWGSQATGKREAR